MAIRPGGTWMRIVRILVSIMPSNRWFHSLNSKKREEIGQTALIR